MIKLKVLGLEHLDTAISYTNLGDLYREIGKNQQAEEYFLRCLKIREKVL